MSDPSKAPLPAHPQLAWLKNRAKERLVSLRTANPAAKLSAAQLAIAREYGFASWRALKAHIDKLLSAPPDSQAFIGAVKAGDLDKVTAMLDADPRLANARDGSANHPAVMIAALHTVWHRPKYLAITRLLVERGAQITIYRAARAGLLEVVKAQLDAEPDLLDRRDENNETPLQHAALVYGDHAPAREVAMYLIQRGAAVDVETAAHLGMADIVRLRIGEGVNVNRLMVGASALNWAVRNQCKTADALEVCKLLLDAGADLASKDIYENGMTPLHHAAEWSNEVEIARLLLDRGAPINGADQGGWTPLDYAEDRGRKGMGEFLRQQGGKVGSRRRT